MSIKGLDFMNFVERRNFIDEKLREKGVEKKPLSADGFLEIWSHYDKDGNLTIEEQEVDDFLSEYLTSAHAKFIEALSDAEIARIKKTYIQGLNVEEGGRISLEYMAKLLPVELGIFVLFRAESRAKTAVEFMDIWRRYDKDLSGYIDAAEFAQLLKDLLRTGSSPIEPVDLSKARDYAEAFLPFFDINHDGKLGLNELARYDYSSSSVELRCTITAVGHQRYQEINDVLSGNRLLPSKENFVQLAVDKAVKLDSLSASDVKQLLEKYDRQNVNGTLEGNELSAFVRDLLATSNNDYSADMIRDFEKVILKACDVDRNGSLDAKELALVIKSIANAQNKGGDPVQNFYRKHSTKK